MSNELKLRNGDRVRLKEVTVAQVDARGFTLSEQDREGYIEFDMIEEIISRWETPQEELERLRAELANVPRKIKWGGGECPVDCEVIVWFRNGFTKIEEAHFFDWRHAYMPENKADDIIAYMVLPE